MRTLSESGWIDLEQQHQARVEPWITHRRERLSRGQTHPVEDFLFNYYPFRPAQLLRWSPGFGTVLLGAKARKFLVRKPFSPTGEGTWIDPRSLPVSRLSGLDWALSILRLTQTRDPQFGCFGLHEWAMVYRAGNGRHAEVPLRLSPGDLAAFVESQRLCCSHYDAFRFFTPSARPLNRWLLEKGMQPLHEQRGCLHTNMDLYKWAYKFSPWVPAELLADTFALAREIRTIDMRASPYDLRSQGYEPICIETPQGRGEYESHQRRLAEASQPLRGRLLACLQQLREAQEPTVVQVNQRPDAISYLPKTPS